jgi:hypothetical protein
MVLKRTVVVHAVALALVFPGVSSPEEHDKGILSEYLSEVEWYGYIKNETALFTQSGQVTGQARSQLNTPSEREHDWGDALKFQNSARLFLNGPIGEESSWHLDLNMIYDTRGANSYYKGYEPYTQYDWFREGFVDTFLGPLDLRLGKQQVVWGTADGIKLLDIINPTDFREFVQNTMEDSRITVWMAKAELPVGETDNIQVLAAQSEDNKYPGLSKPNTGGFKVVTGNPFLGTAVDNSSIKGTDRDQAFIALGTDSITGGVNGFRNITPALGAVSNTFTLAALGGGVAGGLTPFTGITVNDFVTIPQVNQGFGCGSTLPNGVQLSADGGVCLSQYANFTNEFITNLIDTQTGGAYNIARPDSTFEYMSNATFATFNTFVGAGSRWNRDYPDDLDLNYGTRYKGSLSGGSFNYSLNYLYAYDPNPSVKVRWKNKSNETLNTSYLEGQGVGGQTTRTVVLTDSQNRAYGAFDVRSFDPLTGTAQPGAGPVDLEFEETVHRIHNIGASFDSSVDAGLLANPVVLRGEFLYQPNVRVPQIDRTLLGIGDLSNGLKPVKADFFKYAIGLDFLVWTNLTLSGQFIQFINLDYKDKNRDTFSGDVCTESNCGYYTGDPGTLHLSNGLQKGQEYDNYYSLFLSKPFGPSQLGRFNNIILYEGGRGGGWWNRMDVEYQFTDAFVGSLEWNQYWGDNNSIFGQFDKSSNFQMGLKYFFE